MSFICPAVSHYPQGAVKYTLKTQESRHFSIKMVITLSESHVNSLNLEDSDYYELSKYDNLIGARYVL